MILKLQPNAIKGEILLKIMNDNCPDDDEPEFEIIEILEENIHTIEFEVSTNAGELLSECYPAIFI